MRIAIDHDSIGDLKHALTGNAKASFIWIDNGDEYDLPQGDQSPGNRHSPRKSRASDLSQLCWLAEVNDIIVTRQPICPAFARYVHSVLGYFPSIVSLHIARPALCFTEAILAQPTVLSQLKAKAHADTYLFPTYATQNISDIAQRTGIAIAGNPKQDIFRWLNNPCYVRDLARWAELKIVQASECDDIGELRKAIHLTTILSHPVIVKEALRGGRTVVTPIFDASAAEKFLATFSSAFDQDRASYVVEAFLDKKQDVRYEFYTNSRGDTTLCNAYRFLEKRLAGINGVPHEETALSDAHFSEITETAEKVGYALHTVGYRGMIRVDGIIDRQDVLYPILDIHPGNVSTLVCTSLVSRFEPTYTQKETHIFSRHHRPVTFESVHATLSDFPLPTDPDGGIIIMNVHSRRRMHRENKSIRFDGRIKTQIVAPSEAARDRLALRLDSDLRRYLNDDSAVEKRKIP